MGRGLSELQKCILLTALKRPGKSVVKIREGDGPALALLASQGIRVRDGDIRGVDARHEHIHVAFYGNTPRTPATRAAISRAADRLAKRGLVRLMCAKHSNWAGVDLTEAGEALAKELSVNEKVNLPLY